MHSIQRSLCEVCGYGRYDNVCPTPAYKGLGQGGKPTTTAGRGGQGLKCSHCQKESTLKTDASGSIWSLEEKAEEIRKAMLSPLADIAELMALMRKKLIERRKS